MYSATSDDMCTTHLLLQATDILSPGESGKGSSLASCLVRGVAVRGDRGGAGRSGDSRKACPRPESSESRLTSVK